MQIYAFDSTGRMISANLAQKHQNYFCAECKSIVRLRGGIHRQKHFFHINQDRVCRLGGKSMVHLQVQYHLQNIIPSGESSLEERFPEINRIADVVWFPQKLIFEIQCSNITSEEIRNRNADYQKMGYRVVWILHDTQFNQLRVSEAELFLQETSFYFTNIDKDGNGLIYDQFSIINKGIRRPRLSPLKLDLAKPIKISDIEPSQLNPHNIPKIVKQRLQSWPFAFEGDLTDLCRFSNHPYLLNALKIESLFDFQQTKHKSFLGYAHKYFEKFILRPYFLMFQMLLERLCK